MSFADLLMKIEALGHPAQGIAEVPPPELVAFCVRLARGGRQLKRSTLADMANVSLTTLERIERGEKVRPDTVDQVGIALGYEAGYFTAPREPIGQAEAMSGFVERYEHLEAVRVRLLRTQPQVQELSKCHGFLPHLPKNLPEQRHAFRDLFDWLDLIGFLRGDSMSGQIKEKSPQRKLYRGTLETVDRIQAEGNYVLAGTVAVSTRLIPERKIAVVSITSKMTDPGAPKRNTLLVDKRILHSPPKWDLFDGDESSQSRFSDVGEGSGNDPVA